MAGQSTSKEARTTGTLSSLSQPVQTSPTQGTAVMGACGIHASAIIEPSPSALSATSLWNITTSEGTSCVTQAPQQQALNQNPTETTSTITDKPEATLSTPVFVTVTNDQTSRSEPPVFTSVGVPPSDGQVVSATRVITSKTSTMVDLQDTVKWA
ncbi:hypothetical protein BD309DRAFT_994115 [Dichomitus squalens]|nr:hypothetical protein BD309DRAFT_994115 [Dichomitus squalens]